MINSIIKTTGRLCCFLTLLSVAVVGCYNDKEDLLYAKTRTVDCSSTSASYSADVSPIMQRKCATSGCHTAAANAGGAVLENYNQVAALAGRIRQRCIIDKTMPPGTALTNAEMAVLSCWISSGTPNN